MAEHDPSLAAGRIQVMRYLDAAGAALGGFALVVTAPGQAAVAAETHSSVAVGTIDAQVWEAPGTLAVPIGPPIGANNNAGNLPPVTVDHAPQIGAITPDAGSQRPGEGSVRPTAKPATSTLTQPVPALKDVPVLPGQLKLNLGSLQSLVPPKKLQDLVPPPRPVVPAEPARVVIEAPSAITAGLPEGTVRAIEPQVAQIRAMQPTYEKLVQGTGVRWQWLASLHYREATNDPTRSVWAGQPLGDVNWDHGDIKGSTLQEDATKAIEHFKYMAKKVYGVDVNPNMSIEDLKLAFLAYNRGSMYKDAGESPDNSPYVMNGYTSDEKMIWPNSAAEPASVRGYVNNQFGALTVSKALGGLENMPLTRVEATPPVPLVASVELAAQDPLATIDKVIGNLVPPRSLNKVADIMRPPQWKDGGSARQAEANAPKPYFQTPFKGPVIITSEFGEREAPTDGASTCHLGVDFALDFNDPIIAPRDGTVVANAFLPGNGNMLGIMHEGVVTWYFHLNERSPLAVGSRVTTGQLVGKAGSTGVSNGPHLHFAVQIGVDPGRDVSLQDNVNGHYVDPIGFLDGSIQNGNQFNTLRDAAIAC